MSTSRFGFVLLVAMIALTGCAGNGDEPNATPGVPEPCELLTPSLASRLLGEKAEPYDPLEGGLPSDFSETDRAFAQAVAAKSCLYRPTVDKPRGVRVGLQLNRPGLFSSEKEFIQANDHEDGAERVSNVGEAAMIFPQDDGWSLVVLLDDGYSFALSAPTAERTEVVSVGREIAEKFSAARSSPAS